MKDIEFAALLCSRLCHDLISPVGAIANGIEILADEDDEMMRTEVLKLLDQSASQTSNRLQFFRLAFGAAGGFGEKVPLDEAKKAARALFAASKVEVDWKSQVGVMNKDAIKLMLNMVLLAGESLIRGGQMTVEIEDLTESILINITVTGDKVIFQDKINDALLEDVDDQDIEPKTAPAFLARNVAKKIGANISKTSHNEQSFSLSASYPVNR
ncbi:histidine phosphotransferase family protein [Emcibacter sp.]|uniref:histidine phosphotransferase family protein n=1 Tax=Emcibacter sp. TaxID=1979954 RepID=UPI002AA6B431|nr:histidine phosphotransferase family protein [Emcibacter sp.]